MAFISKLWAPSKFKVDKAKYEGIFKVWVIAFFLAMHGGQFPK